MQYGICNLSIVPLRAEPKDTSELVSQVLYGEYFKILEKQKNWIRIRLAHDSYEGWLDKKQYLKIKEKEFEQLESKPPTMVSDMVDFLTIENDELMPVVMGSNLNALPVLQHSFKGNALQTRQPKSKLIETAHLFLNAPYLWGGKTMFGIDCSGFTQIVYKLNGYSLLRDASQQATQGEVLSFIEESEPGDLAFFDNEEGKIIHVGIILENNYIIHAHGKVRIDRLDHTGIFNSERKIYSHKLRVIRKIISAE